MRLEEPDIIWSADGGLRSKVFDDVYFSGDDPLGEVGHVFLGGIGAPEVWLGKPDFTIGETGFGSGLNFLLSWQAWRNSAAADARLHYISVEAHPLSPGQLEKALAGFPEISGSAEALVQAYPPRNAGFHRLHFDDGRVALTLLFGEAAEAFSALSARVDAWYLDGFAPAKNPAMWSPDLFSELARLSDPGAKLATFTEAGAVRRDLEAAGFEVEKRPGFGQKRRHIVAAFKGVAAALPGRGRSKPSGFHRSKKSPPRPPRPAGTSSVAIIGGGIAGCWLAFQCRRQGLEVSLIERHGQVASEASGNPAAMVVPRLLLGFDPAPRYLAAAALYAARALESNELTGSAVWHQPRGAVELANSAEDEARARALVGKYGWPERLLKYLGAEEAGEILGVRPRFGGLYFPAAGCLNPEKLCASLTEAANRVKGEASQLRPKGNAWQVLSADGNVLAEAEAVVIAAGIHSDRFLGDLPSPLRAFRGQIGYLPADQKPAPRRAVSYGGYLTPAIEIPGFGPGHVIGATFDPWKKENLAAAPRLRKKDARYCFDLLETGFPELAGRFGGAATKGRAAIRATTGDHLPVAGPLKRQGLFLLAGLGSKGFLTAPLAAELIASMITGGPLPLERELVAAIDPWRFERRRLRRAG